MFNRVLVANRGEIAVRIIRAVHELGIEAVAVYSTADRDALHVRIADHAVCIGPPAAGYGFLAENAAFAAACADNDVVFIGPSPEVMKSMGDKIRAKHEMDRAGVPTVPGTDGATSLAGVRAAADEIGYPILLKAAAGGGGRGMRLVPVAEELERAYSTAAAEAQAACGDPTLYLEKALVPARHVEIQVLCDGEDGVLTLGERECSIQRRHQKLIEESPSPALTPELREEMEAA